MRLKRLEIHNIASIVDGAIDFEGDVLGGEPIFLICGKTGSGKTTLLDAICLALYNDTPRMRQSPNERYYEEDGKEQRVESLVSDVRQLMRRNTGEASVRLVFEGNDGNDYEALWSVRRARGNVSGTLQGVEWSIKECRSGRVTEKKREVEQRIKEVVGLSFDQFCRSVMLPQGEFTRFLRGKEEERAEILETITGLSIYTEIGKEIYDIYSEKDKAYDVQREKLSDITLLSEEEKAQMKDQMREKAQEAARQEKLTNEARTKKDWMERADSLMRDERQKAQLLKTCQERQGSRKVTDARADIKDWTATAGARIFMSNIDTLRNEEEENARNERQYMETFSRLTANNQQMAAQTKAMEDELARLSEAVAESEPRREMYANSQTIVARLQGVVSSRGKAADCRKEAQEAEKLTAQKEGELARSVESLEAKVKENGEAQHEIDAKSQTMAGMNMAELQQTANSIEDVARRLDKAKNAIGALDEKQDAAKKAEKNRAETEKKWEQETEALTALDRKWQAAEAAYQTAKDAYERQKTTTEDYVRELRHKLRRGERCPVCGQVVESIENDDHFKSLLEPLETMKREKERQRDEALRNCNQSKASIKSLSTLLAQRKEEETTAKQQAEEALATAREACGGVGILMDERALDTTMKTIDARIDDNNKKRDANDKRLKGAYDLQNEINGLQQKKNTLQQTVDACRGKVDKRKEELQKMKSQIDKLNSMASNHERDAETTLKEVMTQITYASETMTPETLIDRLTRDADNYKRMTARRDEVEKTLTARRNEMTGIEEHKRQIASDFPHWDGKATTPLSTTNVAEEWARLSRNAATLKERIKQTQSQLAEYQKRLAEFYQANPTIDEGRLRKLSLMRQQDIERRQKETDQIDNAVTTASAALNTVRQQREEHEKNKPVIAEGEDSASLSAAIRQMETSRNECHNVIGALQKQLALDKEKASQYKTEQERMETMRIELEKWERLKKIFGDAQGKTFRKIAQSYVLRQLIAHANYFLEGFTPRYRMECQAGSLTILLRDAYQGGVPRTASTLSGGESFLVSLSLALGLSSIGREGRTADFLFIDEGFGTLSGDYLDTVMSALEHLHNIVGKKVGIISHIDELRERIKTQIRVEDDNNDNSRSHLVVTKGN